MQKIIDLMQSDNYSKDIVWGFTSNFFFKNGMNPAEVPIENKSFYLFMGNFKENYPKYYKKLKTGLEKYIIDEK